MGQLQQGIGFKTPSTKSSHRSSLLTHCLPSHRLKSPEISIQGASSIARHLTRPQPRGADPHHCKKNTTTTYAGKQSLLTASSGSSEGHGSSGCSSSPPGSLIGMARSTGSVILEEELVRAVRYVLHRDGATVSSFQLFGSESPLWKKLYSEDQSTKDTPATPHRENHHGKHQTAGKGTGAGGDVFGSLTNILLGAP